MLTMASALRMFDYKSMIKWEEIPMNRAKPENPQDRVYHQDRANKPPPETVARQYTNGLESELSCDQFSYPVPEHYRTYKGHLCSHQLGRHS